MVRNPHLGLRLFCRIRPSVSLEALADSHNRLDPLGPTIHYRLKVGDKSVEASMLWIHQLVESDNRAGSSMLSAPCDT